jgi:hypothetical protein
MIGTDDLAQATWQAALNWERNKAKKFDETEIALAKKIIQNEKLNEKVQRTKLFLKERLSYADEDKDELFVNKYCLMAFLKELEKE